jgi:hypothetical protein
MRYAIPTAIIIGGAAIVVTEIIVLRSFWTTIVFALLASDSLNFKGGGR